MIKSRNRIRDNEINWNEIKKMWKKNLKEKKLFKNLGEKILKMSLWLFYKIMNRKIAFFVIVK